MWVVFIVRVALVVGTRPQIIKSAPVVLEEGRRGLELDVVHTGQHYDYELSRVFFNELGLPDPAVNLWGWRSCL
jgi:UDP-N-acetylglucosamine 2-epimerase